ncbi:unnamed protein product [Urochloa humidicola]
MAISTWSARLLLTPASPSRATPPPPRPAGNPTRVPSVSVSVSGRRRLQFARPRPPRAYISAPAPGPEAAYAPPSLDAAAAAADVAAAISSSDAVTWAGVWALLSRHRARIAVSVAALLACTTCTLSMPLFSGRFFETLIGQGNEPLWKLLSKIAVLYTLEPIFTIIFVINMTVIWEQVMARLRSQIFRGILIQKMVFFDRHKVGELTGLLTSDLGSLKNLVSDNISRDRGLRALSEITGTLCILFTLSTELAPVLGLLMVSVSVLVALFKRSTVPTFKSYGIVQARISDCASETFSAIRTVRSFGGEKRQISLFDNLPTQGCITVAGEDIRVFDKREWSRVVSLVNQDPVLFSVSVGENIAYGLPDDVVSKDEIIKAAKAANAHEFIISLPQGYDTLVGERGSLLSGGQRQRIAIARALLKNAPILILDEATSALDATSERLVQEALNLLMKGRTSLVIAHRLSTVQNAHRIAVCSEGKITELGTHAELVAKGGSYASLVGTQRLAFE